MLRRSPLTRKIPLKATNGLQRTPFKRRAPKKRPGHAPKYTAAIKGECCYLRFPGCRSYPAKTPRSCPPTRTRVRAWA